MQWLFSDWWVSGFQLNSEADDILGSRCGAVLFPTGGFLVRRRTFSKIVKHPGAAPYFFQDCKASRIVKHPGAAPYFFRFDSIRFDSIVKHEDGLPMRGWHSLASCPSGMARVEEMACQGGGKRRQLHAWKGGGAKRSTGSAGQTPPCQPTTSSDMPTWDHRALRGITEHHMGSQSIMRDHRALRGITEHHAGSQSIMRDHRALRGITEHHAGSQSITWDDEGFVVGESGFRGGQDLEGSGFGESRFWGIRGLGGLRFGGFRVWGIQGLTGSGFGGFSGFGRFKGVRSNESGVEGCAV
eukprot:363770-Chlamydomonas_euryale.AAC.2